MMWIFGFFFGMLVEPSIFRDVLGHHFSVWFYATRNAAIRGPVTGSCTVDSLHHRHFYNVTCSRQTFIKCINSRRRMTSYSQCRLGINKYFHYFAGGGGALKLSQ